MSVALRFKSVMVFVAVCLPLKDLIELAARGGWSSDPAGQQFGVIVDVDASRAIFGIPPKRRSPSCANSWKHGYRLENPGKIQLELIEVQTGSYLGEDDIIRIEDDYQRS
jgi:hypothetical protein